jgi:adenylyl- and sulfurtransferase ThiI
LNDQNVAVIGDALGANADHANAARDRDVVGGQERRRRIIDEADAQNALAQRLARRLEIQHINPVDAVERRATHDPAAILVAARIDGHGVTTGGSKFAVRCSCVSRL